MVSSNRSSSDLLEYTVFQKKKIYFSIYKNQFSGQKWIIFYKILPKFSDFVYYDDYIGTIRSKCIRLQPVFIQKKI